jgi:hypothetical protein
MSEPFMEFEYKSAIAIYADVPGLPSQCFEYKLEVISPKYSAKFSSGTHGLEILASPVLSEKVYLTCAS